MYFIPQKNKWYSWAVHTRPLYRYGVTCGTVVLLLIGWRYGVYAWLDSAYLQQQAAIAQLQQQMMQLTQAQRVSNELTNTLPMLRKRLQEYIPPNKDEWQQQQFNYVMNEAQKAGIQITSYSDEKEKKKSWGFYRYIQLGLFGKLDQISRFLASLKQSPYMIQCSQIQSSRTEGDTFSASCGLKFMTAS